MPPIPAWQGRIPALQEELSALSAEHFDRPAIEALFRISRRQAQRLMSRIEPQHRGLAGLINRASLERWLGTIAGRRQGKHEILRQLQLHREINAVRNIPQEPTIAPSPPANDHSWPEGIQLAAPGVLQIHFVGPEDLLGRVYTFVQEASEDYEAFQAKLAQP